MAFVLADQKGWLRQGKDEKPEGLVINPLGPFKDLRDGVTGAAGQGTTADFFMWEHFTTKHYWDNGELKRIGEIYTPWPSWMICARSSTDERVKDMAEKIDKGVQYFRDHPEEAVEHITSTMKYSKEDAEAWLKTVRFADNVRGVDPVVIDDTANLLRKAGVLKEAAGGSEHMVAIKRAAQAST